ncbi:MAG: hypothetical protein AB7I35_08665 [Ramlibacter sp.]
MRSDQSTRSLPTIVGILEFVAVVAVDLVFGHAAFYRVLGIVGAAHGLFMAWSRNIPVGVEGQPPSYFLRGKAAVVVGLSLAVAAGALAWFAPQVTCTFSEGRQCP